MIRVWTQSGIRVAHQLAQRADLVDGPCIDPSNELDRFANIAECVVDQMRQRVDLGWLRIAGNDQALASVCLQIVHQRADPARMAGEPAASHQAGDGSPIPSAAAMPFANKGTSRAGTASR